MATASVPNGNFVNGTPADADEVDANFAALVSFLNGSVVHRDGTKAMTAAFDGGGFRVSNVATATAVSDAPRFDQVALSDYAVLGSNTTIATGGTTVATLTVTAPNAGMAELFMLGNVTTSGITYNSGLVAIRMTVSGATLLTPDISTTNLYSTTSNTTGFAVIDNGGDHNPMVSLAAGTNTIVVSFVRANVDFGGGAPTGGTLQIDSGFRFGIVGMA